MSAAYAQVDRVKLNRIEEGAVTLFARGINIRNQRRCPHCDAPVYSRRTNLCGVCDKPLPDACLFSTEQAQVVSTLLAEERQRHRAWLHRANFGG